MKVIGIVGGMGPHAGVDLHRKILEQTVAGADQEHLPVIHGSFAHLIGDRTAWLLTGQGTSPAEGIFQTVAALTRAGAEIIGMPCNTAHASPILDRVQEKMAQQNLKPHFLHMPREVIAELRRRQAPERAGILATSGTCQTGLYQDLLAAAGFEPLVPQESVQKKVHQAISDRQFGIKAFPDPVTAKARRHLLDAIDHLCQRGAASILLACTELPLALPESEISGIPLIDNTAVLARALVREACPSRLRESGGV